MRAGEPTFPPHGATPRASLPQGFSHIGLALLPAAFFLLAASGGFTLTEPAPYEFVFLLVLAITILANAPLSLPLGFPLLFLGMNMAGGLIAIAYLPPAEEPIQYIAITIYLNLSALIVAMAVSAAPLRVLPAIRWGYTLGAIGAAICGILGYFDVAGLSEVFTAADRASGPFADPNVFGPFLVFPAVFLIVDILRGNLLRVLVALIPLAILTLGILLSFSRGAWAHFFVSTLVAVVLLYITSGAVTNRLRIIVTGTAAFAAGAVILAGLISIPEVGKLFTERAKIVQPYDVSGDDGRFDTQGEALNVIPRTPLGYGAYEFAHDFGLAPHNVYLKMLTSNGWLGGFGYIAFVIATLIVGLQAALSRTPWRLFAIVSYATFVGVMLEGLIIDTDHWRHFYLTAGMVWGCYAAIFVMSRKFPDAHVPQRT